MFGRRRVVPLQGYHLHQRVRPGTTTPTYGCIAGVLVVPTRRVRPGYDPGIWGWSYPPGPHPRRGWARYDPKEGTAEAADFYHHAHCPRSVRQAHPKSHPRPTAHRQSRRHRRLARLPGGDTSTRYVKAGVVHYLHTAVTDTRRKIYVLDRARDRLGKESSYYS